VCTIVLNTPPDKVDYVVQKAVANGSKRVYVHDGADKRQTGDPAYFYLSPYLMIPISRFSNVCKDMRRRAGRPRPSRGVGRGPGGVP